MGIRLRLSVFALIVIILAGPVIGQRDAPHPDFSGTWKLNLKKSGLPGNSLLGAEMLVVTCNGPNVEMRHASVIDGHEIVQNFITDGQARTITQSPQIEIETRAYWQKSSLVVVQTTHHSIAAATQPAVLTSRWTLSKDGNTLKFELSTLGFSQVYVYNKQ